MSTLKERERDEAVASLREILKPGDTLYTVNRHIARSGMMRAIDVYKIDETQPVWLSRQACRVTGYSFSEKYEAVRMDGCGMDMGFALVYAISQRLFPDGFGCVGEGCPSNDHSNGDCDYTRHVDHAAGNPDHICAMHPETCVAPKHWHKSGGYALRHRWM